MATLTARLDKLEALTPTEPLRVLFLVHRAGTEATDTVKGIRFDDGRTLQRQQGESLDALQDRARAMITGGGVVIVFADYVDR